MYRSHFYIDPEFVGTYGLDVVAGRNFLERESCQGTRIRPSRLHHAYERAVHFGYKACGEAVNQ